MVPKLAKTAIDEQGGREREPRRGEEADCGDPGRARTVVSSWSK